MLLVNKSYCSLTEENLRNSPSKTELLSRENSVFDFRRKGGMPNCEVSEHKLMNSESHNSIKHWKT